MSYPGRTKCWPNPARKPQFRCPRRRHRLADLFCHRRPRFYMRLQIVLLIAVASLSGCAKAAQPRRPRPRKKRRCMRWASSCRATSSPSNSRTRNWRWLRQAWRMAPATRRPWTRRRSKQRSRSCRSCRPSRLAAATTREKAAGTAYLTKAATEKDATKTTSGLVYKSTRPARARHPRLRTRSKCTTKAASSTARCSTVRRSAMSRRPSRSMASFRAGPKRVQLMKVGGKAQVTCPPELAYGDEGRPPQMRGGATLVFDIELLEIVKEQPAAAAVPAPAAQPAAMINLRIRELPPPAGCGRWQAHRRKTQGGWN